MPSYVRHRPRETDPLVAARLQAISFADPYVFVHASDVIDAEPFDEPRPRAGRRLGSRAGAAPPPAPAPRSAARRPAWPDLWTAAPRARPLGGCGADRARPRRRGRCRLSPSFVLSRRRPRAVPLQDSASAGRGGGDPHHVTGDDACWSTSPARSTTRGWCGSRRVLGCSTRYGLRVAPCRARRSTRSTSRPRSRTAQQVAVGAAAAAAAPAAGGGAVRRCQPARSTSTPRQSSSCRPCPASVRCWPSGSSTTAPRTGRSPASTGCSRSGASGRQVRRAQGPCHA